jgi:hypothetical protein
MKQNSNSLAAGYRNAFRAAADKATGPAKPLFESMVTLWDGEMARLQKIAEGGGDVHRFMNRVHKEAARGAPKWRALFRQVDKLAKQDPAARKARDSLFAAQNACIRKLAKTR